VLALVAVLAPGPVEAEDPVAALKLIRPKPVQRAREFQVATPDGGRLRLGDFKGRVVFLNFWATWCKPCEEEMPAMQRLHEMYRDRGLVVLAISADAEGAAVVTPFLKKHGLTFPVGLDPRTAVSALYGVWAIPATFIIDRRGDRVLHANGPRDWAGKTSQTLFEALLR
jgi:peroxiredoxin